ncbi:hypothetical protein NDU88_004739 [Pleurodeles waltl]|uniref:Uncharacterized protein n=1 Tax=Pleurodeles waltl TaxID=8319 RepID=A0AAV7VKS6_PLEWA|nr:hypothetical protein NDU88_004739 [Pleurodeles waltl]
MRLYVKCDSMHVLLDCRRLLFAHKARLTPDFLKCGISERKQDKDFLIDMRMRSIACGGGNGRDGMWVAVGQQREVEESGRDRGCCRLCTLPIKRFILEIRPRISLHIGDEREEVPVEVLLERQQSSRISLRIS